jgi:poly(hydroxyalkanoate) depolymerase family esterase
MNHTVQNLMNEAVPLTWASHLTEAAAVVQRARGGADQGGPGEFSAGTHTHSGLTRGYKLYAPPHPVARRPPLVVMLHGCSQDPDDFAAGTAMNERAREQGFFVLYPAQSPDANPARCWNWFKHNHQQRDGGEPAMIASMTLAVVQRSGIDARRVYIAGMSAGGAMAAIVADAYPEIFSAVGVHSGLPRGAASDAAGALAVMRSGNAGPRQQSPAGYMAPPVAKRVQWAVPTIVFHGDHDQTVHPRNGEQVIAAVLDSAAAAGARPSHHAEGGPRVEQGVSAHGRHYTRFTHRGDQGTALAEHWLLHGSGHAWSGGHPGGSYTDAKGPDATREMLRFFFGQPHA